LLLSLVAPAITSIRRAPYHAVEPERLSRSTSSTAPATNARFIGPLVYCWLQAFREAYELLPRASSAAGKRPPVLGAMTWRGAWRVRLAARCAARRSGDAAAEACWMAAALQVAGKIFIRDAWTDLAGDVFGKLARRQQPAAPSSPPIIDNPEARWYHELALLHAAATHAVQARTARSLPPFAAPPTFICKRPTRSPTHHLGPVRVPLESRCAPVADGMLHAVESL